MKGLVVDVGNSGYKYAVVGKDGVGRVYRKNDVASICRLGLPKIGVSVVPSRRQRLEGACSVRWVDRDDVLIDAPAHIGLDRLVALYAAKLLYGSEMVAVIDMGTFLTISVLYQNRFVGGYILPGLQTMMLSYRRGALLPQNVTWNETPLNRLPIETVEAMQGGVSHMLRAGLESIIADIRSCYPEVLVVGTGGAALPMLQSVASIQLINPTLILEGLARLAQVKKLF